MMEIWRSGSGNVRRGAKSQPCESLPTSALALSIRLDNR
jgi:hypothetical protein